MWPTRAGRPRPGVAGRSNPAASVAGRAISRPPASEKIIAGKPRRAVLLMAGDETALPARRPGYDQALHDRLEQLGFSVEVVNPDEHEGSMLEPLSHAQVVVLSPSIYTTELSEELVSLPVPMVALESSAFSRLGLTGLTWKRDVGPADQRYKEVVITKPGHPLAAGLTGQTTVLQKRQLLRWGLPSDDAVIVAQFPGAPAGQSALFAYERGSEMPGGRAAARRVGIFLGNGRVIRSLTTDGWRLFDAAVNWSAADSLK
jgi:hypothetical protein